MALGRGSALAPAERVHFTGARRPHLRRISEEIDAKETKHTTFETFRNTMGLSRTKGQNMTIKYCKAIEVLGKHRDRSQT